MYGFRIEYTADGGKITLQPREAGLAGLYKLTDCQMVEVAGRGVLGGVEVALVCDEEGAAQGKPNEQPHRVRPARGDDQERACVPERRRLGWHLLAGIG